MPDIIVFNGGSVFFIEAKECRKDTTNWDLEKDSHDAQLKFREVYQHEIYYVWPDFTINNVFTLNPTITGPYMGIGSGTPFWLIKKDPRFGENEKPSSFNSLFRSNIQEGLNCLASEP
jgi:hypothetical protein